MKVLVIQSSPNTDGLTAACADAAISGVEAAGGSAENVRLTDLAMGRCRQCDNGWGLCLQGHECDGVMDDFQSLHGRVREADGLVLVTPVYWGDLSESMKAFSDRLRRCEATLGEKSHLAGVPMVLVAAAGGSGGGLISCLGSMERWTRHVRAQAQDLIGIKRITRQHKLNTIREAAEKMVRSRA